MKIIRIAVGLLFLCFSLSPIVFADSLIVNGGFETGNFSGWTISGDTLYSGITHNPIYIHSGSYAAWFGSIEGLTYMSQTITTIPGASYELSGWLMMIDSDPPDVWDNEFHVWWNDTELLSLINSDPFAYSQGNFPGLIAEDTSTVVQFGFRNPPGVWAMDDISVTPTVPEPTSLTLLGTGLGGLALAAWRRRK